MRWKIFRERTRWSYEHDDCGDDSGRGEHLLELIDGSHQEQSASKTADVADGVEDGECDEADAEPKDDGRLDMKKRE